jgi:hypothetical protein
MKTQCTGTLAREASSLESDAGKADFAFSAPHHPNFLMYLKIPPLYTLLVVHKQNSSKGK